MNPNATEQDRAAYCLCCLPPHLGTKMSQKHGVLHGAQSVQSELLLGGTSGHPDTQKERIQDLWHESEDKILFYR